MRSIKFLATVILLVTTNLSHGQYSKSNSKPNSVRLNIYGSYVFEDSFDSYYDYGNYYQGKLKDGFQYGGGIEFEVKPNTYFEALYLRQDTNAPTQYYNGGLYDKYANFKVGMNYILLGGNHSFKNPNAIVEGFGGFMVGLAVIDLENPNTNKTDSVTKFAWGLKGGAIVWATKKVGLKFQAQLLSVAQSIGGGVYFGTGGAGAGLSSYSSLYQFSLGGGLVFELGQ